MSGVRGLSQTNFNNLVTCGPSRKQRSRFQASSSASSSWSSSWRTSSSSSICIGALTHARASGFLSFWRFFIAMIRYFLFFWWRDLCCWAAAAAILGRGARPATGGKRRRSRAGIGGGLYGRWARTGRGGMEPRKLASLPRARRPRGGCAESPGSRSDRGGRGSLTAVVNY